MLGGASVQPFSRFRCLQLFHRPAADPARSLRTHLSLPATTTLQLLCAVVPSIAIYRLEGGLRRWGQHTARSGSGS